MMRFIRRIFKTAEYAALSPVISEIKMKQEELDRRASILERRRDLRVR